MEEQWEYIEKLVDAENGAEADLMSSSTSIEKLQVELEETKEVSQ